MTVTQLKQSILDARTDIKAKVVEESGEVKLLVQGNAGGATPAQLDEIGAEVVALRDEALVEIGKISDNAAGNPDTQPEPGPTA